MKKIMVLLALLLMFAVGCGESIIEETEDYKMEFSGSAYVSYEKISSIASSLKNAGFFGEHNLEKLCIGSKLQGNINGSLFGLNGSIETFQEIRFAWRYKKTSVIISSLPTTKIIICPNAERATPTIRFKWQLNKIIHQMESQRWEKLKIPPEHPNQFIIPKMIVLAQIEISPADLEKGIYLSGL